MTRLLTVVALVTAALTGAVLLDAGHAVAQVPATEEQALAVERQLLCPMCTNERLDVCATAICQDMKQIIRERLAAGATPDDIILYFETRYGEKVRAELPAEGFNLWLYGWIGASVLAVGAVGSWFLLGLRRRAPRPSRAAGAGTASGDALDDAWLDAQITDGDDRSR